MIERFFSYFCAIPTSPCLDMNILIVSNFFIPNNCIASFRIEAFAKYFREAGHSVTVVTEGDRDESVVWNGCRVYYVEDRVLSESKLKSLRLRRKKWTVRHVVYALQERLTLDPKFLWRFRAYRKVEELIGNERFDILLSSYGHLSPHMIAYRLRREMPELYWIADMRDEMSKNLFFPSWGMARRIRPYERKILRMADLVLSVSEPLVRDFRRLGGHDRVLEITNGYDYEEVHDVSFQPVYTMAFIGRFYGAIDPCHWFEAFSGLVAAGDIPPDSRIDIIGNFKKLSIPENIRANVFQTAEVDHAEAIRRALEADTLVLVHPKGRQGVYTGKVFDYLATNKPILALCDSNDVIAKLLEETGAGFVADEADVEAIKKMVLRCYSIWKKQEVLPRNWDRIRHYTRKKQVQNLLDYLSRQKL